MTSRMKPGDSSRPRKKRLADLLSSTVPDNRVGPPVGKLFALGLLLLSLASSADTQRAQLVVGAVIPPIATLKTISASQTLTISQRDVEAGFLELPMAERLEVYCNSRNGYLLNMQPRSDLFTRIEVLGEAGNAQIGADGGSIVRRWPGQTTASFSLGYRIHLRPQLPPGIYPWPLQLAVAPL